MKLIFIISDDTGQYISLRICGSFQSIDIGEIFDTESFINL